MARGRNRRVSSSAWAALALLVVLVAGCGSTANSAPSRTELKATPAGNFVLYVSDQSFALPQVDITIRIDGKLAVSDRFAVGNEHNWKQYQFALDPGMHHLTALSRDGRARITSTFRVKEELNGVVDYWYSPGTRRSSEAHVHPCRHAFSAWM